MPEVCVEFQDGSSKVAISARSLSDYGVRSETSGKLSAFFRSFEAHSGSM